MAIILLKLTSVIDPAINLLTPGHYFESLNPDKTTFQPPTFVMIDECKPFDYNWAAMFCVMADATGNFLSTELLDACNPFGLKDDKGVYLKFQTTREGIRTALTKFSLNNVTDFSTLPNGAAIIAMYSDMVKFALGANPSGKPPVITPPDDPVKPVPPLPSETPAPAKPTPPASSSPGWFHTAGVIIAWLLAIDKVAQFFIPGAIQAIVSSALALLSKLFGGS